MSVVPSLYLSELHDRLDSIDGTSDSSISPSTYSASPRFCRTDSIGSESLGSPVFSSTLASSDPLLTTASSPSESADAKFLRTNSSRAGVHPIDVKLSFLQDPELKCVYDPVFDAFVVGAGSFRKIVEWLVFQTEKEAAIEDMKALLLNYRTFSTPKKLFSIVMSLYDSYLTWEQTQKKRRRAKTNTNMQCCKERVFEFLKIWYSTYSQDFRGGLMGSLFKFVKRELSTSEVNVFKLLLLRQRHRSKNSQDDYSPRRSSFEEDSLNLSALSLSPKGSSRSPHSSSTPNRIRSRSCTDATGNSSDLGTTGKTNTSAATTPRAEAQCTSPPPMRSRPSLPTLKFGKYSPRSPRRRSPTRSPLSRKSPHRSPHQSPKLPSSAKRPSSILDVTPIDLAHQLSILEVDFFNRLQPLDLIQKQATPPLQVLKDHFNKISWLVATEIVTAPPACQLKTYKVFLATAKVLAELENYQTLMQILAGLESLPVARLKTLNLSSKHKETAERLHALISPSNNYATYREKMRYGSVLVPMFPVLQRDLIYAREGNEDYTADGLINFNKLRLLTTTASQYLSSPDRSKQDQLLFNPNVFGFLMDYSPMDEQGLYAFSKTNVEQASYLPYS